MTPDLPPLTVLVVDDEKNIRRTLQLVLEGEGYRVLGAETAGQALAILASPETPVDLAILDVKLPDMSGLDALAKHPQRRGDERPADHRHQRARDRQRRRAGHQARRERLLREAARARARPGQRAATCSTPRRRGASWPTSPSSSSQRYEMIGRSAPMQRLFHEIEKVAPTKAWRAHHRRERDGQGAHRPRAPPAFPAGGRPLREGQLRGHPAGAHRERALRPRARRVHRRPAAEARASSSRRTAARSSSTRSATWT